MSTAGSINLTLTQEDCDFLSQALDEYLRELGMEISDTENWVYRDGLKKENEVLSGILTRLRRSATIEQKG